MIEKIRPVLKPITSAAIHCGPIGHGLRTKYAVNLYVIALAVGLAESMNLAGALGIDFAVLGEVLNAGPAASAYSRNKITKILTQDWSPQATTKDCYNSSKLICKAVEESGARSPLIQTCRSIYKEATDAGYGEEDSESFSELFSSYFGNC